MKTRPAKIPASVLLAALSATTAMIAGCQSHSPSVPPDASPSHLASPPERACQYLVTGGIPHPGPRTLKQGETVSMVLLANLANPPGKPITIVLMRRAPEGKTRQLIEIDANGKLMDEKQDVVIRDGDEISFPGGAEPPGGANPADR